MALFDRSLEELKEAFVRARFAEANVFGRADIEDWCMEQRTAESPDDDQWTQLLRTCHGLQLEAMGNEIQLLRQFAGAVRFDKSASDVTSWDVGLRLRRLLFTLSRLSHCCVYRGRSYGVVIVIGPNSSCPEAIVFENECGINGDRLASVVSLASINVMDVIYETWRRYGDTTGVREFLCNALMKQIAVERTKAETEFTSTVAVSADGTKIVCADDVVVVDEDGTESWYDPAAFAESKILRGEMFRSAGGGHEPTASEILLEWYPRVDQVFIPRLWDFRNTFVTKRAFCPELNQKPIRVCRHSCFDDPNQCSLRLRRR